VLNNYLLIHRTRYLFNPRATADAFDENGYYKTGDIGRREGEYYFIMGRASVDSKSISLHDLSSPSYSCANQP
jgi:acyl-CoA synthetase (AMP-forming)/AMP-acid ligase II